jgi:hypothetical protein
MDRDEGLGNSHHRPSAVWSSSGIRRPLPSLEASHSSRREMDASNLSLVASSQLLQIRSVLSVGTYLLAGIEFCRLSSEEKPNSVYHKLAQCRSEILQIERLARIEETSDLKSVRQKAADNRIFRCDMHNVFCTLNRTIWRPEMYSGQ